MATETITRLVDDIDGSDATETVKFALDGHSYEIDLSSDNATALRATLAPYVEAATAVKGGKPRAATSTRRTTPTITVRPVPTPVERVWKATDRATIAYHDINGYRTLCDRYIGNVDKPERGIVLSLVDAKAAKGAKPCEACEKEKRKNAIADKAPEPVKRAPVARKAKADADTGAMREWARRHGLNPGLRGRLRPAIVDAYNRAHAE